MRSEPNTLVERDQLAEAAVIILKNEEFVPKGKRWPFSRPSKAHKDYERAVQEITERRRAARESALDEQLEQERVAADTAFVQAKLSAEAEYDEKIALVRKPYNETEAKARKERDAAVAAANLAYQTAIEAAQRVYEVQATLLDQARDELIQKANSSRDKAYAASDAKRKVEMLNVARELKTIPFEGPTRIIEDRERRTLADRKKALIGLIDMAGREDFDDESAALCLSKVAAYVLQDRLDSGAPHHHKLMDAGVLEALTDLARRMPERRPIIVHSLHEIISNNPGYSSTAFIKNLTELYVIASSETLATYSTDALGHDQIVDQMREQIADALKLTPRPSQMPQAFPRESSMHMQTANAEITADVDVKDLAPADATPTTLGPESDAIVERPAGERSHNLTRPPLPPLRRGKRAVIPE